MTKRYFGSVRRLPSGRFQARYTGPDGRTYTARTESGSALTFDSRQYADAYLARVSGQIQAGKWVSPDAPKPAEAVPVSLRDYAETWFAWTCPPRRAWCTGPRSITRSCPGSAASRSARSRR